MTLYKDVEKALDELEAAVDETTQGAWHYDRDMGWVYRTVDMCQVADFNITEHDPDAEHVARYDQPFVKQMIARERARWARHEPVRDSAFSLINWEYCSCGANGYKVMSDGIGSMVPVAWPCEEAKTVIDFVKTAGMKLETETLHVVS